MSDLFRFLLVLVDIALALTGVFTHSPPFGATSLTVSAFLLIVGVTRFDILLFLTGAACASLFAVEVYVPAGRAWYDAGCAAAAVAATWGAARLSRRSPTRRRFAPAAVEFFVLFWVFVSLTDRAMRPASVSLKSLRTEPAWPHARVAVALSGGGFRAALFHAGVLYELDSMRIRAQAMSTVSGGSIVGAFYARGGAPQDFLKAVVEHRFNLKRELINVLNAPRLLLSLNRIDIQAEQLDRIFLAGVKHRGSTDPVLPELMICATDILEGSLIGVTPHGVVRQPIATALARSQFIRPTNTGPGSNYEPSFDFDAHAGLPGDLTLASLVAASGAFPGAFNPLKIAVIYGDDAKQTYLLADGGVADNYGVVLARAAQHLAVFASRVREGVHYNTGWTLSVPEWRVDRWNVDFFIVSDGSAIPNKQLPSSTMATVSRAIDTVYLTTGGDDMVGAIDPSIPKPPAILLSPRLLLEQFHFGTELVLPLSPPGVPPAAFSFTSIPSNALDLIIENMPETERTEGRRLVAELDTTGVYREGKWKDPRWEKSKAEAHLYDLVHAELSRRVNDFLRTSTLKDQIEEDTARSIFLLGRYVTCILRPYLEYLASCSERGETCAMP